MFTFFESRLDPFPPDEPGLPPKGLFAFGWHYSKAAGPWLAALGILTAIIGVGEVLLFRFLGTIVDWLTHANRETFLAENLGTLLGMLSVVVVLPVVGLVHSLIMHQVLLGNYPMIARWRMHRYLLRHSMNFFANDFAGRISTKVMQTSLAIRESVLAVLDIFIYVLSFFISMVVAIAAADFRLAIPVIIWVGVYVTLIGFFIPKLRKSSAAQADARSTMTGRVVDSYTNIATVKLFSHAGREESYARESMDGFLQTVYRQFRLVTTLQTLVDVNNHLVLLAVSSLSIWFWMQGSATVGAIAVCVGLVMRINGMSQWVMWQVSGLFENIGMVYDGMDMLTKPHDIVDAPNAGKLTAQRGEIRFENIRFHYGKAKGVIDNLSLDIRPGEKIGLVGRSGAGKTTLMNMLLRFYDLEGGRILIDGQDISKVTQDSLRALIGVVTQDTSLLHRSIRENIAYGKPGVTDADIITAARRANAWEFIQALEDQQGRKGLDAQVGERGVKLSGGQRQRIAIARVFLKDAPILILDEATSALDSEVEAAIQENLFSLMEGKTVIAIAHRLSTLTEMDRLVVLDKGMIIETGTHAELAAGHGIYADLWNRQSGGFLPDQIDPEEEAAKKARAEAQAEAELEDENWE